MHSSHQKSHPYYYESSRVHYISLGDVSCMGENVGRRSGWKARATPRSGNLTDRQTDMGEREA